MNHPTAAQQPEHFIPRLVKKLEDEEALELRPSDAFQDYKREDLRKWLPQKFWDLIKHFGEPNVDADPDLQAIASMYTAYVIKYVLECTPVNGAFVTLLENAIRREHMAGSLFKNLAAARRAVINSVLPMAAAAPDEHSFKVDPREAEMAKMRSYGYENVKWLEATGEIAGIRTMSNGEGVIFVGLSDMGHRTTMKFPTREAAEEKLAAWDGNGTDERRIKRNAKKVEEGSKTNDE